MQIPEDYHLVNLLPPDVGAGRERRRLITGSVAGLAVLALLLGFLWYQRVQTVNRLDRDINAQIETNRQLLTEIRRYDAVEAKYRRLLEKENRYKSALNGEVSWFRFLQDIAGAIPAQDWLVSFAASANGGPAEGQPTTPQPGTYVPAGTFSVGGQGFDHPDSADWLVRISMLPKVADLWVSSSSKSDAVASTVSFASAGSLTSEAWTPRAKRAERGDFYGGQP